MESFLLEAGRLQDNYDRLISQDKLSKKAMCNLCVPFRDKYHLTDLQTLDIARRKLTITQISKLYRGYKVNGE